MPDFGRMRAAVMRRPALWLFILALTPHVVASIINIVYNQIRIISHLTEAQQEVFVRIVLCYDTIGYCLGIALALRSRAAGSPGMAVGGRAAAGRSAADRRGAADRRQLAVVGGSDCLPVLDAGRDCLSPGPDHRVGLAGAGRWAHLLISFVLSGLIAATYSMYFVEWITLCVTYPELWCDRQGFRATAAAELRSVPVYLRLLQVMAGLIPLIGAVVMMIVGPQEYGKAILQLPGQQPDRPRHGRISPGHVHDGLALPGLGCPYRVERNPHRGPAAGGKGLPERKDSGPVRFSLGSFFT